MAADSKSDQGSSDSSQNMARVLYVVNRLNIKAQSAETLESLIFLILNDTVNVAKYDRAFLWNLEHSHPKLLGISGQADVKDNVPLVKKWTKFVKDIKDQSRPQMFYIQQKNEEEEIKIEDDDVPKSTVLWIPISSRKKLYLGLCLEIWHDKKDSTPPDDLLSLLVHLLIPSYGLAYEKLSKNKFLSNFPYKKSIVGIGCLGICVLLLMIEVPLRIIAPCEVIPENPYYITAPIEGIIEEIKVKPGERVKKGDIVFEYDKRVPLQQLKVAQKEVQVLNSEVKRSIAKTLENDAAQGANYAILAKKLEKEEIEYELAKYKASLLTVNAGANGIVLIDNPDELRGKPVKVGEKILAISEPNQSKIKIWIPESDNVTIELEKPIKIILNVSPDLSRKAVLSYISHESTMSDQQVPSFIAEAEWVEPQKDIKMGLKGSAVIYGEKVTLFFYIVRRPWAFFRYMLGI